MWRRALRLAYSLCAIVGLVDLIGRGLLIPLTGTFFGMAVTTPASFSIVNSVTAPDGLEKAVFYVSSPVGSFCTASLSVVTSSISDEAAWLEKYLVFTTMCGDEMQFSWESAADGRRKPRLRINADAASGLLMRRFALHGEIAVAYKGDR